MLNNVIQKDHELVCVGCGCVVGQVDDFQGEKSEKTGVPSSVNSYFLGSALDNKNGRTEQQRAEERVLRMLIGITKKYALPDVIAFSTLNELKKRKRGFYSEKEPIKQLLKILAKDDYYIYIHKYRAIKSRYEKDFNF